MAKHDSRGRSEVGVFGKSFVGLPSYMLKSSAYQSLGLASRAALVELLMRFNGKNNGKLAMSAKSLATALPISRATASRAMAELVEKGFLDIMRPGSFSCKVKRAAEYRVTFHPCNVTNDPPTKSFMRWTAKIHSSASPESIDGLTGEQPKPFAK